MKNVLTTLLCKPILLLTFLCWAGMAYAQPSYFTHNFGDDKSQGYGVSYFETKENAFYVPGSHDGKAIISKLDQAGNLIWTKQFTANGSLARVFKANDGNYVAIGYGAVGSQNVIHALKIKPSGALIWEKTYRSTGRNILFRFDQAIGEAEDAYYITHWSEGQSSDDISVLKIKTDGNVLWSKEFDLGRDDQALNMTATPYGGIIVVGSSSKYSWDGFALEVKSNGTLGTTKRIALPNGQAHLFGIARDGDGDGYWLAAQLGHFPSSGRERGGAIRLSGSLKVEQAYYFNKLDNGNNRSESVVVDGTGHVYMLNFNGNSSTGPTRVIRLEPHKGELLWTKEFTPKTNAKGYGIVPVQNSPELVSIYHANSALTNGFGSNDATMAVVDTSLNYCFIKDTTLTQLELNAADYDLSGIKTANITYTVTDLTGVTNLAFQQDDFCNPDPCADDMDAPIALCQDVTLFLNADGKAVLTPSQVDAGSSDECSEVTLDLNQTEFSCTGIGLDDHSVILTVSDASGNLATCSANVTLVDTIAPVIICKAEITVSASDDCNAFIELPAPEVIEICNFTLSDNINGTGDASGFFPLGTTTVIYTATDADGNVGSCQTIVTVVDDAAPIISCPEDITVSADENCEGFVSLFPEVFDNCQATGTGDNLVQNGDMSANKAHWQDCDNPAEVNHTEDVYGGTDPNNIVAEVDANSLCQNVSGFIPGQQYELTFLATRRTSGSAPNPMIIDVMIDGGALATSVTRTNTTVFAFVQESFIFTATQGTHTLSMVAQDPDLWGMIVDDVAIRPLSNIMVTNNFNGSSDASDNYPLGTTTVVFTATDASGNVATCATEVTVVDDTAPTAICQNLTVYLDDTGHATITAADIDNGSFDNCSIDSIGINRTDFDCRDIGFTVPVTLTLIDAAGNQSTCQSLVTIEDDVAPVITCPGDFEVPTLAGCDVEVTLPELRAFDNCCAPKIKSRVRPVNANNQPTGPWSPWVNGQTTDTYAVGRYKFKYKAKDTHGNVSTCTGFFEVIGVNYMLGVEDAACNAACDGEAEIFLFPNIASIDISWSTGDTGAQLSNLCAGSYSVTLTSNRCDVVETFTIGEEVCDYCESYGTNTQYEFINTVSVGSINNTSGNDGGYGDYTAQSTTLALGSTNNISLTPGFGGNYAWDEYFTVFIDLNRDGDFLDADELVFTGNGFSTVNGTFNIPATATAGSTRMRITMQWQEGNNTPCTTFGWGETEDYTVILAGPNNRSEEFPQATFQEVIELAPAAPEGTKRTEDGLTLTATTPEITAVSSELSVFPNPIRDQFQFSLKAEAYSEGSYRLTDMTGRVLIERQLSADDLGNGNVQVDARDLVPGAYLLSVQMGAVVKAMVVLKQ